MRCAVVKSSRGWEVSQTRCSYLQAGGPTGEGGGGEEFLPKCVLCHVSRSRLATAWLVVCLRKHAATSPLTILWLANVLVAVVGVPFLGAAPPDPGSWGLLLVAGVIQLGVPTVLYGKAIPHVRAIEAMLIPVIEPVLNPLWVWLVVGEVPSDWALLGGTIVVGAVTVHGLALVWHTPREREERPHAA
jgi:drug/metabolite transporter (DMT)-like permease